MPNTRLPFENRWTSGTRARHWFLRLEREGFASIEAIYAAHERSGSIDPILIDDVPVGFTRDWLLWKQKAERRRRRARHHALVALLVLALAGISLLLLRGP